MKTMRIWIWPAIVGLWILLVSATSIYDDFHSFDQIKVSGPVELFLVHGEEASISQPSNENLSISINDKTLYIKGKKGTLPSIVKVTYHDLRKIHATNGAIVIAREAIPSEILMVELHDMAFASLNLKAETVTASAYDNSRMKVKGKIGTFMANFHDSELEYGRLNTKQRSININSSNACTESSVNVKSRNQSPGRSILR